MFLNRRQHLNKIENSLIYNLNLSVERVKIASFGTSDTDNIDLSRVFKRDGLGGFEGLEAFWCGLFFFIGWFGVFCEIWFCFFLLTGADQKTATLFCGSYKT